MTADIVHLSRMVIPRSSKDRLLALFISAHLDESHTHRDARYALMDGCIATEAQWAVLDYEWQELLTEFGISSLHAVEMENRRGQFKDWTDPRERLFRRRAREVYKKNTVCSVAAAVDKEAHKRFRVKIKTLVKKYTPDSIYGECFHQCMIMSCFLVQRKYCGERISFVLASGHPNLTNAVRIFERNKRRPKFSPYAAFLGSISIGSALSSLQVADLVANETMKEVHSRRFKNSKKFGTRLRSLWDESFFVSKMIPEIVETRDKMRAHAVAKLKASGDAASPASKSAS